MPEKRSVVTKSNRTKSFFSVVLFALALAIFQIHYSFFRKSINGDYDSAQTCPQADEVKPSTHAALWRELGEQIGTEEFKLKAVDWLGGAVRIPYVVLIKGATA